MLFTHFKYEKWTEWNLIGYLKNKPTCLIPLCLHPFSKLFAIVDLADAAKYEVYG